MFNAMARRIWPARSSSSTTQHGECEQDFRYDDDDDDDDEDNNDETRRAYEEDVNYKALVS